MLILTKPRNNRQNSITKVDILILSNGDNPLLQGHHHRTQARFQLNGVHADIAFVVPKLDCSVIGTTYKHLFRVLDQFRDVGGVFCRQVSDQVSVGYVPHFYGLVQTGAQKSDVVVEKEDGPDEVQVARHCFEAG